MMKRVNDLIAEIVRKEGGFVSAERARRIGDSGGATNHGVSLRYARSKGLIWDLDRDGDVDEDDIRLVTPAHAFNAFLEDFYTGPGYHRLPEGLQPQVTDFAVNTGPGPATTALQTVIRDFGYTIAIDGACGPKTARAAALLVAHVGSAAINNALVDERIRFYRDLVRRRPETAPNLDGWLNRARSFRA
ncbi:hypothetical protein [Azospirillum argentinense]|uniref:glycoside hydrolase family 108 protein n=1 Tax=Azospirillum argentinense TaxID=2970906 RepID=UPI0032DEF63E